MPRLAAELRGPERQACPGQRAEGAIQSLDRALDILATLAAERRPLGCSELERRLGLHKTTVFRLLQTLERRGFVVKNPETRRYWLGFKLLEYADAMLRSLDLKDVFLPHLRRLSEQTGETTGLFVRSGYRRVCIAQVESTQEVRRVLAIGQPLPLYPGSSGKVILAHLPRAELEAALDDLRREGDAPSDGDWSTVLAKLESVRKQGYATSLDEPTPGAWAISAPIRRGPRDLLAILSVSGPRERYLAPHRRRCQEHLLATARDVTRQLGLSEQAD